MSEANSAFASMPDASPAKWDLAQTSWFFETMVLLAYLSVYRVFDERYNYLFNSYYESVGERQPRPRRGMLTLPTLETVRSYRAHVDAHVADLLGIDVDARVRELIEQIGRAHV